MSEHESLQFQQTKLFTQRLYKELHTIQQFRFRFSVMKIAFVTGLLGIGAMNPKIGQNIDLSPALLLAPFVAVLFDILGMAATVAIYRIDAFLWVNAALLRKKHGKGSMLSILCPSTKILRSGPFTCRQQTDLPGSPSWLLSSWCCYILNRDRLWLFRVACVAV